MSITPIFISQTTAQASDRQHFGQCTQSEGESKVTRTSYTSFYTDCCMRKVIIMQHIDWTFPGSLRKKHSENMYNILTDMCCSYQPRRNCLHAVLSICCLYGCVADCCCFLIAATADFIIAFMCMIKNVLYWGWKLIITFELQSENPSKFTVTQKFILPGIYFISGWICLSLSSMKAFRKKWKVCWATWNWSTVKTLWMTVFWQTWSQDYFSQWKRTLNSEHMHFAWPPHV